MPSKKAFLEERNRNIPVMFRMTALAMILSEITSVAGSLIDGVLTSRFLGIDIYSGISMLRPFNSILLMLGGFLSTGCNIVCSRKVGLGEKEEANRAFNPERKASWLPPLSANC